MHNELELPLHKSRGLLADSRIVYMILYVSDLEASRFFYETVLGLRLINAGDRSAEYDTGQTCLCLHRASEHGFTLTARDHTADLTFLVNDLESVRTVLANRGVEFSETLRYEIGASVDFYDPDGHWISIYEPSAAAMTWPSGEKLRAILEAGGKSAMGYGNPETLRLSPIDNGVAGSGLEGRELVYLFLFVPDAEVAFHFFHEVLGLRHLECRPCRRGSTDHQRGVVKYDAGGLMLTTHLFQGASLPQEELVLQRKGVAPVFRVTDIELAVEKLTQAGVNTGDTVKSEVGQVSGFEDPFGRVFYLCEASLDKL